MKTIIRWFFLALTLAVCFPLHADTGEPLLRINGKEISADEFIYYYRRSPQQKQQTPEAFLPCFVDFKLQVADALRMKLDTLPDFKQHYHLLQAAVLQSLLTDEKRKQELCHTLFSRYAARLSRQEWVRIEEITLRLPQHATAGEERKVRQTADSIYTALGQGASFTALARHHAAATCAASTWQPTSRLLQETQRQLALLAEGSYSTPFATPVGIHLVKLYERKTELSFEEALPWLSQYVMQHRPMDVVNDSLYALWQGGTLNLQALPFREAYETLLVAYRDARCPAPEPPQPDEKDLEKYFKQHKANYRWELPHFRGAVIHCRNKKDASTLKKLLKKLPEAAWEARVAELSRTLPELRAEIEAGLFQIGTNRYVDKLAFKCGSIEPRQDLPHTFVVGKRLKKGPEKYTDVREAVEKDYRNQLKTVRTAALSQQFKVEINHSVLKTVNCSGSN